MLYKFGSKAFSENLRKFFFWKNPSNFFAFRDIEQQQRFDDDFRDKIVNFGSPFYKLLSRLYHDI